MNEKQLETIPLFAPLSKRERQEVARRADEVDVAEGRHLVDEGDWAYEFFAIEEGTAEVLHGGERLAELGPGDFLGEMAALDHSRRRASVVATSPMTVMVMTDRDLRQITQEMPGVGRRIKAAIDERAAALAG